MPSDRLAELVDQLYDLSRDELRILAWEALLISDGPDHISGEIEGPVRVGRVSINDLYEDIWWFTVRNPGEI